MPDHARALCAWMLCAAAWCSPVVPSAQGDGFERVRDAARAEIAASAMPGMAVAIVHAGRVVFAEGFGVASVEAGTSVTADTVFQVGSAGRMLTAAAVLEAAADDRLSLNEPISRVSHGLDPAGMRRLTLRPTVAMTWPLSMGYLKQADGSLAVVRPMAHDTRLCPAGYVLTTARDPARFATALLDEGRIDGRAVLRAGTLVRSMSAVPPEAGGRGPFGRAPLQSVGRLSRRRSRRRGGVRLVARPRPGRALDRRPDAGANGRVGSARARRRRNRALRVERHGAPVRKRMPGPPPSAARPAPHSVMRPPPAGRPKAPPIGRWKAPPIGRPPNPRRPRLARDAGGGFVQDLFAVFPDLPWPRHPSVRRPARAPVRRRPPRR